MNVYVIGIENGHDQWMSMGHDEEEALMNHAIRIHGEMNAQRYVREYLVHTSLGTETEALKILIGHYMQ